MHIAAGANVWLISFNEKSFEYNYFKTSFRLRKKLNRKFCGCKGSVANYVKKFNANSIKQPETAGKGDLILRKAYFAEWKSLNVRMFHFNSNSLALTAPLIRNAPKQLIKL